MIFLLDFFRICLAAVIPEIPFPIIAICSILNALFGEISISNNDSKLIRLRGIKLVNMF